MPALREEIMSQAMTKFHLDGLPVGVVLHRFTEPDHGDPHDHPFPFTSFIICGGYEERVYDPSGNEVTNFRRPGDCFRVPAKRIHRITRLLDGECWTLILPGPWERKSRFWQFRDDGAFSRAWDEHEWTQEPAVRLFHGDK